MSSSLNQKMSLYIPRVDTRSLPRVGGNDEEYEAAAKDFIAKQFAYQKIGDIDRIDLVSKKTPDGYTFYIAFVHFKVWHNTRAAHTLQDTIRKGEKKATVQYHKDWYWIVTENRNPRTESELSLQDVVRTQQEEIERLTKALAEMTALHTEILSAESDDAADDTHYYTHLPEEVDDEELAPPPPPKSLTREVSVVLPTFDEELAPPPPGRLVRQVAVTMLEHFDEELAPPPPDRLVRQVAEKLPSFDEESSHEETLV